MKNQIEILEDLFKLDSHSEGINVNFRTYKNILITKLSIGSCHSDFCVAWESDYREVFDYSYEYALEKLKVQLTTS